VNETSEFRGANILAYSGIQLSISTIFCVYNHYSYLYIAARVKDLEKRRDGLVAKFLLAKSQTAKTNGSVQVTKPTKVTELPKANRSSSRLLDSANLTDESCDTEDRVSSGFISSAEGDDSTPAASDGSESSQDKVPLFTSTPDTSLTTMSAIPNSSGSKRQNLDNSLKPQPKKRSRREVGLNAVFISISTFLKGFTVYIFRKQKSYKRSWIVCRERKRRKNENVNKYNYLEIPHSCAANNCCLFLLLLNIGSC